MNETIPQQTARVLEAFMDAPGQNLTTKELHAIPFCTNVRARISDLRKMGYVIRCERIAGTNSSRFWLEGKGDARPSMVLWGTLPSGMEIWGPVAL